MDSLVYSSIVVEAKAEYNDTYESTVGSRKLKVAEAAKAMEESISLNCINTVGLMEATRSDSEATRELYTFAAFGVAEGLSGRISPFIIINLQQAGRAHG